MDDLLGFARFDQHTHWRARGRVEGEVDEIEPSTFEVERNGVRWLLTASGTLMVVGDADRDLVAEDGQLRRHPAKRGFLPYLSANLLLQVHMFDRSDIGGWTPTSERRAARHADRPATDLELSHLTYELNLGIDRESGVWIYLENQGFTITVDELTVNPPASKLFDLLDQVPGVDLSPRVPITEAAETSLRRVQDASGLTVEVMTYDDQTALFQLILLDADDQPRGLVTRKHDWSTHNPVFGGIQHRTESADWVQHLDTTSHDPLWIGRIVKALEGV